MSEQTAVTVKKIDAPAQWGSRAEVGALASRFSAMLPNAKDFTHNELLAIAQYCIIADINPYRGEAYFYKDRGKLQMVDGYKILVRWAKDKDSYQDRDEDLPCTDGQAEHVRVWILKDADRHKIKEWTELGAPWKDAFEMVATYADGVVTTGEATRQPPTGWDWRQVARKRALKNALNLSHGAPSPQEMAEYRYKVNGTQTIPADWEGAETLSQYEAERLAEVRAKGRNRQLAWDALTPDEQQATFEQNVTILRGDESDPFDDRQTASPAPQWNGATFDAGEDEPDPAPEQKANGNGGNGKRGKTAAIKTGKWAGASVALAERVSYYQKRDGTPDGWHMAGAAAKCGYAEITDANLEQVIAELEQYAADQETLAALDAGQQEMQL